MLQAKDFLPITAVTSSRDGNRTVWRYTGNDLNEAVKMAEIVRLNGGTFFDPFIARPFGTHKQKMDHHLALLLAALCQIHIRDDKETFAYPTEFPYLTISYARGFTTNYNYLYHFGLVTKESRGSTVHYQVTPEGFKFYFGKEPTYQHVINQGSDVIAFGPRDLYIGDLLTDEQRAQFSATTEAPNA